MITEPTSNGVAVGSTEWLGDCDRAEKETYAAYRKACAEEDAAKERRRTTSIAWVEATDRLAQAKRAAQSPIRAAWERGGL